MSQKILVPSQHSALVKEFHIQQESGHWTGFNEIQRKYFWKNV